MNSETFKHWPFTVLPPEKQTEQHRQEIRYVETAFQEGFQPCISSFGRYKSSSHHGREGWIIDRGRMKRGGIRQWEVWLVDATAEKVTFWVDDFGCAGAAVLQWLRGVDVAVALAAAEQHVINEPNVVVS
jgi:hypothetical protein